MIRIVSEGYTDQEREKFESSQEVQELQDYICSELKYIDTKLSDMKDVIYDAFDNDYITREEENFLLDWLNEVK